MRRSACGPGPPDGREYGRDELDPLPWREMHWLLEGLSLQRAVTALDECLAAGPPRDPPRAPCYRR